MAKYSRIPVCSINQVQKMFVTINLSRGHVSDPYLQAHCRYVHSCLELACPQVNKQKSNKQQHMRAVAITSILIELMRLYSSIPRRNCNFSYNGHLVGPHGKWKYLPFQMQLLDKYLGPSKVRYFQGMSTSKCILSDNGS